MHTANWIGAGRLGKTLAKLMKEAGLINIQSILNASHQSAEQAAAFIGQGKPCKNIAELSKAAVYFITTPDQHIEASAVALVKEKKLDQGDILVHCSGSLSSDVLAAARQQGCLVISVHPIKSFAESAESMRTFSGTYCSYEGDEAAFTVIEPLFKNIGAVLLPIDPALKHFYAIGNVIANNYLVTLHHAACACYKLTNFPEDMINQAASRLMRDALKNLESLEHRQALTGPLQRGEEAIIQYHLNALSETPHLKNLYESLADATRLMLSSKPR